MVIDDLLGNARRGLTGMSPSGHGIVAHYYLNHGGGELKQR